MVILEEGDAHGVGPDRVCSHVLYFIILCISMYWYLIGSAIIIISYSNSILTNVSGHSPAWLNKADSNAGPR